MRITVIKKIWVVVLSLLSCSISFSQEDDEIDEIIENMILLDDEELMDIIEELNKYQVLLVSVDFESSTYFLGRDLGLDQFNVTTQVMYENSNGIFGGISGNYYDKFDPKWDVTVLTAGYGKGFGKNDNFRLEGSYSRYIFSDADSNDFENSLDFNVHLTTNDDVLGSTINTSYFFGDKTGFQSSLSIYGNIKLFDLNEKGSSQLTLGPDVAFIFGSENIDTSRIDNFRRNFPFIERIIDSYEKFDLRNIQLQIPIVFELDNFNIEAGYNINFPKALEFENNLDTTGFFNIGVSYLFSIK